MSATIARTASISLTDEVQEAFQSLDIPHNSEVALRNENGGIVALPKEVQETVLEALHFLIHNGEVAITRMPDELSSSTAADILGVSRPTIMKWAKEGKIKSFKVGTHTRFRRDEVLELKRLRAKKRSDAFDELRQFELEHFGPLAD
nr:DNA binding domain, excisionase family [Streptococcus thermophilus]